MSFKDYSFDKKLIERITSSIKSNAISHAYIFEGDLTTDLSKFSLDFVKAVMCKEEVGVGCDKCITCEKINHGNYEDLYIVEALYNQNKTVKSIRDEQIEELQVKLKNKPNGERNIAIIKDSDTLTSRAQNRLLKTLEEPSIGTIIILLCNNMDNLLDTVKSRSIKYHIYGETSNNESLDFARNFYSLILTNSNFYTLKDELSKNVKSREDAFTLLDALEKVARNFLLENQVLSDKKKERIFNSIYLIEEARKDLVYKVSYMTALKNLVIKI